MLRPALASPASVALLVALCASCTKERTEPSSFTPFAGVAYPERRAKIVLPASSDVGLLANGLSDTLTFVALDDARSLANVPVGRDPVDVDGPHHLAIDREHTFVVTTLAYPAPSEPQGPHAGHSHGTSDRYGFVQKLALDDLRLLGEVRVDPNPGDIAMSDDGTRVVVTHYDLKRALSGKTLEEQRANLMVIDPRALARVGSPEPRKVRVCVAPHGVALSPGDGRTAFVACYGEDAFAVVDLTSPDLTVTRTPLAGASAQPGSPTLGPYAVVASPDGATLAVSCQLSKEVRLFDASARAFRDAPLVVSGAPFFPAFSSDAKTLYVPVQAPDAIVAVDVATTKTVRTHPLADGCQRPHDVSRSTDGRSLYVVCETSAAGGGAVVTLDAATLEEKARTPVGSQPDRMLVWRSAP